MSKTNVICLLPVKNESWILERFLDSASKWADKIIVLDHNSADGCQQIAEKFEKVKLIRHPSASFDEGLRRKLLWDEARKIPGKRLVFSIDADEMLSANWVDSPDWQYMLDAPPGTRFRFDWLEVRPGIEVAAVFDQVAALVDDGTEFQFGEVSIHTPRIPDTKSEIHDLKDIKLLHFIVIDPNRMLSKHRYLKSYEYLENGMRPWRACITYQDIKVKSYDAPIVPMRTEWIRGYTWLNRYKADAPMVVRSYWYDLEVLNYFDRFGVKKFRKLNIWDVDWQSIARHLGRTGNYRDPRTWLEKKIHRYIEANREELKINQSIKYRSIRLFGKTVLRALGW